MLPITIQANPHLKSCASRIVPFKLFELIVILLFNVSIAQPAFFNSFTCEKRPTYILSVIVEVSSAFVHTTVNICCKSVGKEGYISSALVTEGEPPATTSTSSASSSRYTHILLSLLSI